MRTCPNCGSELQPGADYCLVCGAAIEKKRTEIPTVTLYVSAKEARQGCKQVLRYPGGPTPIKVDLPAKMYDGMVLYINEAKFCDDYGNIVTGPLRIIIRVQGKKTKAWLLIVLSMASAVLLGILIFRELKERKPVVTEPPVIEETAAPEVTAPPVTPVPTEEPVVIHYTPMQQKAAAMIPHFEIRYYLNTLDDRLLENFCAMYSAVSSFEPHCTFPREMDRQEFSHLALIMSYECPELLQFSTTGEITFTADADGRVVSAEMPLVLTRQEFAAEYGICAEKARTLAQSVAGQSDSEKEMAAYEYLTGCCFYNFNAASAANAYGALGEGQAKCDGISLAMKWLLEEMDIPCMVMAGTTSADAVGHAWNIVCIDGEYYDLDVTNDVMSNERDYKYYGAYNVSRFWIREKYSQNVSFAGFIELPGSLNMNNSYHHLRGEFVYTGEEYEERLFAQLDALGDGEAAFLQFESWDEYNAFRNNINNVMARWKGSAKGSFNYKFAHLDEFKVCRITIDYV